MNYCNFRNKCWSVAGPRISRYISSVSRFLQRIFDSYFVTLQPRNSVPRVRRFSNRSDFLVKSKRRVGRKFEALISAVGTLFSYIETPRRRSRRRRRRRRQGAALYWASPKHKTVDRDRRSSLEGDRGGIIESRLFYIVEIGLLKNYAESRGLIPRGAARRFRRSRFSLSGQFRADFTFTSRPLDSVIVSKTTSRALASLLSYSRWNGGWYNLKDYQYSRIKAILIAVFPHSFLQIAELSFAFYLAARALSMPDSERVLDISEEAKTAELHVMRTAWCM